MEKLFDDGENFLRNKKNLVPNAQVESPVFDRMRNNILMLGGEKAEYINIEESKSIDTATE